MVVEVQVPAVAVIVKVVVCAAPVVFVSDPVIVAPVPLAAMPVRLAVLSLVQLKVVPVTALGFVIVMVPLPSRTQSLSVGLHSLFGPGLTVTVTVVAEVQALRQWRYSSVVI